MTTDSRFTPDLVKFTICLMVHVKGVQAVDRGTGNRRLWVELAFNGPV